MTTMNKLRKNIRQVLKEHKDYAKQSGAKTKREIRQVIEDELIEIVDCCIPIYHVDLIELLKDCNEMDCVDMSEHGHCSSVMEILQMNAVNVVIELAYEEFYDMFGD